VFLVRLLVAAAPVVALLGGILWLRWRAYRAAALAWLVAVWGALIFFGTGPVLLAAASAKGLSLALLVMLIVWAAVFLYNLVDDLGAVQVIAARLMSSTGDPLLLGLLLAWTFSGFMQGIAGFGVPVAIVAPLMLLAGFSPVRAIAAVMIGHSWAITFGSMGSSFYAIGLVMRVDLDTLGPLLAAMFFLPILLTGLSVAHLAAGWSGVGRAAPLVLMTAAVMDALMWAMNVLGAAPVSSMLPGLLGSLVLWGAGRTFLYRAPVVPDSAVRSTHLSFRWAFLPYMLLTVFSIAAQIPSIKQRTAPLRFALNFPAQSTALGFMVAPADAYAPIQLVGHPAPLLLLSAFITYLVYSGRGIWKAGAASRAWQTTVRQTTSTTVGVSLMVMMALVIADSGMAAVLAAGAEAMGEIFYLLAAPFIGLLGAFVTGSNTNSNIMFGPLQLYAAQALALNTILVAAAQTLGGSIGSGVAPDKALIGVSVVGAGTSEEEVMRHTLPYGLLAVLLTGVQVLLISALRGA
jgi:lactate permease